MNNIKKHSMLLLACMCIAIVFSATNAFAVPQAASDKNFTLQSDSNCAKENIQDISINVENADHSNMQLAEQMEKTMVHHGYSLDVTRALYKAYLQTGVDFKLLVLKAIMESDYGRFNVAAQTSARGVFQYIEPTWMVLMHRYGEQIGYGHYARAITYNEKTKTAVLKGPARHLRGEILALRHNPEVSALIKSHQIIEETDVIRGYKNGKAVTPTDHYVAHMLGLYNMKDFYRLVHKNPGAAPARSNNSHMREAAKMNRSFFYRGSRALSARQVYSRFEAKVNKHFNKITKMSKAKVIQISMTEENTCDIQNKTPEDLFLPTLKTNIR